MNMYKSNLWQCLNTNPVSVYDLIPQSLLEHIRYVLYVRTDNLLLLETEIFSKHAKCYWI
jgi:hypothetical protein